jgi:hypothetical protein
MGVGVFVAVAVELWRYIDMGTLGRGIQSLDFGFGGPVGRTLLMRERHGGA